MYVYTVGTNEKVALTKEVKENIEKALELNPEDGASWHVLGMWHTGVSNLNFMMKAALKALFGGMPEVCVSVKRDLIHSQKRPTT